ncbi:MAG: hypothetical protein IPO27_07860 [Bacteroidetes bacterium]|nr:hypothetical protein [Bacteroidota bacterium]
MKRLVIMALLLFIITTAVGQSMKNNLFYGFWPGNIPYVGTSLLNFSSGAPTNLPITTPMGFTMANGFMNDSTGNILFYSNGVFLFNSQNTNIAGCDSICLEDNYYLDTLSIKDGLPISQLFFVIPKPGNNSHFYYMFQLSYNISINSQGPWLNFHLIDMDGDNGHGENVSCNHQVIYDTLTDGFLTGVKHANGRDWWIICNKAYTNLYYKVLVTPDTMIVSSQKIGPVMDSIEYTGQSNFSNDGKWYARADANGGIVIMQFDRCTGQFFNVLHDTISKMGCGGVGFSPNNKRLYVSTWLDLYQYNLEDTINMLANKIKVAHTDSMILPVAHNI